MEAAAAGDLEAERKERAQIGDPALDRAAAKVFRAKARARRLSQLESGCRTLKVQMGKARDELREQRYYRFQLRARQMRGDIDGWEKALGCLYGVTSDFGSSLWRPLACLTALAIMAGFGYFAWAIWLGAAGPGAAWEGQGMALAAVFKPFSTLGDPVVSRAGHSPFPGVLMDVNPAVTMGVRLATALQSLLSGVLIVLFGLAVKRRFQIS